MDEYGDEIRNHQGHDGDSSISIMKMSHHDREGIYPIRVWELDENSTRYDKLVAAPSDENLHMQWLGWVVITAAVTLMTSTLLLSIVTHRRNRREPFNLYLIYLIIPDLVFSFYCAVTCFTNFIFGAYWSEAMCKFQAIYCVFGIGSYAWLNAVITFELHKMLKMAKTQVITGQRYLPPTPGVITKQACAVYLYTVLLGVATVVPFVPVNERLITGLACLPADFSHMSSVVFYLLFLPLFAVIPVGYVAYAAYDIYRHELLPTTGKSRLQAFFFGRLVVVYLIFWIPSILFIFVLSPWTNQWITWISGGWSHLQGLVSAIVSLMKPDLYKGFVNFFRCRFNYNEDDGTEGGTGHESRPRGPRNSAQIEMGSVVACGGGRGCAASDSDAATELMSSDSFKVGESGAFYPGIGGRRGRRGSKDEYGEPIAAEQGFSSSRSRRPKSQRSFKRVEATGCIREFDPPPHSLSSASSCRSTTSLLNSLQICSVNEDTREGFIVHQDDGGINQAEDETTSDIESQCSRDGNDTPNSSSFSSLSPLVDPTSTEKRTVMSTTSVRSPPFNIPAGEEPNPQHHVQDSAAESHPASVVRSSSASIPSVEAPATVRERGKEVQQPKRNYWRARDMKVEPISISMAGQISSRGQQREPQALSAFASAGISDVDNSGKGGKPNYWRARNQVDDTSLRLL